MKTGLLKKIAVVAPVTLGIAAGIAFTAGAETSLFKSAQKPATHYSDFPVNELGEAYGSDGYIDSYEDLPELYLALGDHGEVGYLRRSESEGQKPSSPEEALRLQEERAKAGNPKIVLNLYAADGKTVIDTFTKGDRELSPQALAKFDKYVKEHEAEK